MPRSNGVYTVPAGSAAVANETIESAKFNALVDDLEQDANTDRPIVAGGTGASTAVGALDNLSTESTSIASAATTDLSTATGAHVQITGTDTISAFGTVQAGAIRVLTFAAALTLTHNASSLILPGAANIATAAGDVAIMKSLGSGNWKCIVYTRADGTPIAGGGIANVVEDTSPQLGGDLDVNGNSITSASDGNVTVDPDGTGDIVLGAPTVTVEQDIVHSGDTNNKVAFGTDTQDHQTGGSSRLDISNSGVRMGGSGARVTTILDEDAMGSDSATALATQQSIKAYVDASGGGAVGLTDIGSFIFAKNTAPGTGSAGDTRSGSDLEYANLSSSGTQNASGSVGVGTWRAHGYPQQNAATVFERIS